LDISPRQRVSTNRVLVPTGAVHFARPKLERYARRAEESHRRPMPRSRQRRRRNPASATITVVKRDGRRPIIEYGFRASPTPEAGRHRSALPCASDQLVIRLSLRDCTSRPSSDDGVQLLLLLPPPAMRGRSRCLHAFRSSWKGRAHHVDVPWSLGPALLRLHCSRGRAWSSRCRVSRFRPLSNRSSLGFRRRHGSACQLFVRIGAWALHAFVRAYYGGRGCGGGG
jgi:hypothetical protein